VTVWRPFLKIDLRDEFGPNPAAAFHLLGSE
jgi:hypothetical protein